MKLLHKPIQRKLSAIFGAQVTFERLNISLLGGSLDAHGVTVAGDDAGSPVLTVKRVRAEVSLASALKGEIVIRSLMIERPVLSIIRRADGKTNLPHPLREEFDDLEENPEPPLEEEAEEPEEKAPEGRFRFDVQKVVLVDGEAHFRSERDSRDGNPYHASAAKIMAELTHREEDDTFDITMLVENVGRRDQPAELGQIKLNGKLTDAEDLSRLADSGLSANLEIGEYLKARVECDSIRARSISFEASGAADLGRLWLFVPPGIRGLQRLEQLAARGSVELKVRGFYDPEGLRMPEISLRASDVAVNTDNW